MMYAETFKWVLEDHPSVGCECRLTLSLSLSLEPIVLKAAMWPVGAVGCCAGPLRSKMAWVSPALEEGFSDILLGALTGAASAVYA